MPTEERLDEIAQSIGGCGYYKLAPEQRAIVFGLAIQSEISDKTFDIADTLSDVANDISGIRYQK